MMKKYCFDIDDTICKNNGNKQYMLQSPLPDMIEHINTLFDQGHEIILFTARGSSSGIDWFSRTEKQLKWWGVKYTKLMLGKPPYDIIIDDKAINAVDYRREHNLDCRVGVITGQFDVIHPGYIELMKDAKNVCDYLVVLLQKDASVDRPIDKFPPLLSLEERKNMLLSIRYVDEIKIYETEKDLYDILANMKVHVRILGSDYLDKDNWTGDDLGHPVYYHNRSTRWSTTSYKIAIADQVYRNLNKASEVKK